MKEGGLFIPDYEFPEMKGCYFALNQKQRSAIVERDHYRCQFPIQHECNSNPKTNEVHHIKPDMAANYAGLPKEWIDSPENVLTLCEHAHKHIIHPDTHITLLQYRTGHKEAFHEMQQRRAQIMKDGRHYHFNVYDDDMKTRAEELTEEAKLKGWVFPLPSVPRNGGGGGTV